VWSVSVVVGSPFFDDLARLFEAGEQVLVEAFVAQPSVEALDEAILHWFARSDVVPFDAARPPQSIRGDAVAPSRSGSLHARNFRADSGHVEA
jgi:hypothetical protein